MDEETTMRGVAALAEMFQLEGTEALFTLMGDGNMQWVSALADRGARTIYARHEHCAVSMAMGYARASGRVGVASVTWGPGLTQIMTALTTAAIARLPLVILAGETPLAERWNNQRVEQAPFVEACGARYRAIHHAERVADIVREAFLEARLHRRPVVIGVPMDIQRAVRLPAGGYRPSTEALTDLGRIMPDSDRLAEVAHVLGRARRVVILAGRGALISGAGGAARALGDRLGALYATTLPMRGFFDDEPYSLGVAGGYCSDIAREMLGQADLVLAVGATLGHFTVDGGRMFPRATLVQIDAEPRGIHQGRVTADVVLRADAKAALEALLPLMPEAEGWRDPSLARRIAEEPADAAVWPVAEGEVDPRDAIAWLDAALPKDWEVVNGAGHSSYFGTHLKGRPAERFHTIREFGAIGSTLSYGMGVAVARPESTVLVLEGDGGFLMHAQELETIRRHGLRMLICLLDDAAYGAELHKLRSDGLVETGAAFGREDLSRVATGFGLHGAQIRSAEEVASHLASFLASDGAAVWDFPISDRVLSPTMRRAHPPVSRQIDEMAGD